MTAKANITPYWCVDSTAPTGHFKSMKDGTLEPFTITAPLSFKYGAYPAPEGSETRPQALTRLQGEIGATLQVIRCYDSGSWIPDLENEMGLYGFGAGSTADFIASFEQNSTNTLAGIAAGTYDSDINGHLSWLSTNRLSGQTIYSVFCHEFDGKIAQGTYTLAQWVPAWSHYLSLVVAHDDPGVLATMVWTGTSFPGASGRYETNWPSIVSASALPQAMGWDRYQNSTTPGTTLQTKIQPCLDEIDSFDGGIPSSIVLILPETGWSTDNTISPDPLAYVESCSWAESCGRFACLSWFDSTNTANNHLDSQTGCAAAWGALI